MTENISAEERGAHVLRQLRADMAGISEIIPLTAEDDFHTSAKTMMLENALLMETVTSAVKYERTASHIAQGALDHYLIAICLNGELQYSSGRREQIVRPGDIFLMDMGQPSRTLQTPHSHLRSIALPRAALAPKLANPDSANATILSGSDTHRRLLASQFAMLWQPRETGAAHQAAAINAMAAIAADAVGQAPGTDNDVGRAGRNVYLAMIKRHIENNLDNPLLAVDYLCRRFRISRAGLYRLFEAEGGLADYIQRQRLNHALRQLVSPQSQSKDVTGLAVELQFSSASNFIRAFRRRFGLPPGEIKALSAAWRGEREGPTEADHLFHRLARAGARGEASG